jgi:AcrR family transcriptional regulator
MDQAVSETTDLWANLQPDGTRRLLLAALETFSAQGYNATTTREIARLAGMSPSALYVHYKSKAALLSAIGVIGHSDVLRTLRVSLEGVDGPTARLSRLIATFVTWHARHPALARVIQFELHAIPTEQFGEIGALREELEALLVSELQSGIQAGAFVIEDLVATRLALLSLGIDVARWWRPVGLSPEQLGDAYASLALRMVGACDLSLGDGRV